MFLVKNIGGHLMDIINHAIGQEFFLKALKLMINDKK
jgi:hypothetical protein